MTLRSEVLNWGVKSVFFQGTEWTLRPDILEVRIDFTRRGPGLGRKVVFFQGTEWTLCPDVLDLGVKSILTILDWGVM